MVRYFAISFAALLFAIATATATANNRPAPNQDIFPPTYIPSGEHMYKQYCAACHGADAKGHGPLRIRSKHRLPTSPHLHSATTANFRTLTSRAFFSLGQVSPRMGRLICLHGALYSCTWTNITRPLCGSASTTFPTTWHLYRWTRNNQAK